MSHFSLLVIVDGEHQPNQETLAPILQPWHEYECTGVKDEYVVFVDEHDKVLEDWNEPQKAYRGLNGEIYDGYEDVFYREPTAEEEKHVGAGSGFSSGLCWTSKDWGDGRGYRAKVYFVPEGFERTEVPRSHFYESIEKFAEDYHGYNIIENGRIGHYTNPNRKWDWWVIGGRWSGMLRTKPGSVSFKGRPGIMGSQFSSEGCDVCRIGDLDIEGMRQAEIGRRVQALSDGLTKLHKEEGVDTAEAFALWKAAAAVDNNALFEQWRAERKAQWRDEETKEAEEANNKLPDFHDWMETKAKTDAGAKAIVEARKKKVLAYLGDWGAGIPGDVVDIESWAQKPPAFSTFAVVKAGEWYARGKMGWWATVTDEKNGDDWQQEFGKLLEALPPETWIAIVDCHI